MIKLSVIWPPPAPSPHTNPCLKSFHLQVGSYTLFSGDFFFRWVYEPFVEQDILAISWRKHVTLISLSTHSCTFIGKCVIYIISRYFVTIEFLQKYFRIQALHMYNGTVCSLLIMLLSDITIVFNVSHLGIKYKRAIYTWCLLTHRKHTLHERFIMGDISGCDYGNHIFG